MRSHRAIAPSQPRIHELGRNDCGRSTGNRDLCDLKTPVRPLAEINPRSIRDHSALLEFAIIRELVNRLHHRHGARHFPPRYTTSHERDDSCGRLRSTSSGERGLGKFDGGDRGEAARFRQRFQRELQVGRMLETLVRVLRQATIDYLLQARRERSAELGNRWRIFVGIAVIISADVPFRNAGFPVSVSYRITPTAKMSLRASATFPRTCSSDM